MPSDKKSNKNSRSQLHFLRQ